MDMIFIPQGSENPTAIVVIGALKLRNDAMIYSTSASSCTLSDANGVKVEADLPII